MTRAHPATLGRIAGFAPTLASPSTRQLNIVPMMLSWTKLSPTLRCPRATSWAMRADEPRSAWQPVDGFFAVENGVAGIGLGRFRLVAPHHVADASNPSVLSMHRFLGALRGGADKRAQPLISSADIPSRPDQFACGSMMT
jgi:hypothetical protein